MALDFSILCPKIERIIDKIEKEYQNTQGLILTEDDLKCNLYKKLSAIAELNKPVRTQDHHIFASYVHSEVSWYGEMSGPSPKLAIKPDITILDPEHLSILHGYEPIIKSQSPSQISERPNIGYSISSRPPQLPSKQFAFAGKAITFELKFAREGISDKMLYLIKHDYCKIMRLFRILDDRGEGNSLFSYLIIFDKYRERLEKGKFANFLRANKSSPRHKIIYKTGDVKRLYPQ